MKNLPPRDALNPNNPVARATFGEWHKIAALIMHKLGVKRVEITNEDVDSMTGNIGIADDKGYIEVFLLTPEETEAEIKKHGGRVNLS